MAWHHVLCACAELYYDVTYMKGPKKKTTRRTREPTIRLAVALWCGGCWDGIYTRFIDYRKQRVTLDDEVSGWSDVLRGVPQGSILGPLLLTIYLMSPITLPSPSMLMIPPFMLVITIVILRTLSYKLSKDLRKIAE